MGRKRALHKKWSDYTEEEVYKIQQEVCMGCKYFVETSASLNSHCSYIADTGKRRGCRPELCDKKELCERKKPKDHIPEIVPSAIIGRKYYKEV